MANNIWSSLASTDYSLAANWSLARVPTGTDVAYFDATSVVNCTLTADIIPPSLNMVSAYTGTLALGTYNCACTTSFVVAGKCTIGVSAGTGLTCTDFSILSGGRMSSTSTLGNPSIITISGNYVQTSTNSSFVAAYTNFTVTGNGGWTGNGTLSSTQYNNMTLTFTGSNTLTYGALTTATANGFLNLICGASTKTTTLASNFSVINILTVGAGTLTGAFNIYLLGTIPLSLNTSSTITISGLQFYGLTQTIPSITSYGCNIYTASAQIGATVTQTGDITIGTGRGLYVYGSGAIARQNNWKTDGYNLTVAGDLQIGAGGDNGLKKIDATHNGTRYSTITVGGNWLNYGTGSVPSQFVSDISTVIFNKASGTQTLNNGSSINTNSFFNLIHSGAGILQLLDHCWVNAQWLNSAGTFDPNSKTLTNGIIN